MATPLVAGMCCGYSRVFEVCHGLSNPSAAAVKGIVDQGARDLAGQYIPSEADQHSNNSEALAAGSAISRWAHTARNRLQFWARVRLGRPMK